MIKGLGIFLVVLYAGFSFQLDGFGPGVSFVILLILTLASGLGAVYCLAAPEGWSPDAWSGVAKSYSLDPEGMIREFVALATLIRQEGLLSLESRRKDLKDPFLRHLMKKVMDGHEKTVLLPLIRSQCEVRFRAIELNRDFFERFVGLMPLVGLVPTLVILGSMLMRAGATGFGLAFVPFGIMLFLQLVLEAGFGSRFESLRDETRVHFDLLEEGLSCIQDGVTIELVGDRLRSKVQVNPRWADA
jgi:flagellar motor component MotA